MNSIEPSQPGLASAIAGRAVLLGRAWGRLAVRTWRSLNLARQFVACASLVLLPAMIVTGLWVSGRIKESATQSAGASAALYIENFFEPYVQPLAIASELSQADRESIEALLVDTTLGRKLLTYKIWAKGGKVVSSNRQEIVGRRFEPSRGLRNAWKGLVSVEFDVLRDVENQAERSTGIPLLEVYIPLRARGTDQIIAVAVFYEKAYDLQRELSRAQILSWLVVCGVTLSMLSALFAIVRRGSQTITQQRQSLEQRVGELSRLLSENRDLRARIEVASARASESSESYLRRIGADLHDGPAQLVSLALLKLDDHAVSSDGGSRREAARAGGAGNGEVRHVLNAALRDIRSIAAGLSLPEIDTMSLDEALAAVIERHERLTGTAVEADIGVLPVQVPYGHRICAYRFVQEGLSNAFRHAAGASQRVTARSENGYIVIEVSDRGKGIWPTKAGALPGLGLRGMTDRIESLGGRIEVISQPKLGTRLVARLPSTTGVA